MRLHTSLPISSGERLYGAPEFREIWASNSVDIIQPDITQCGGFFETKKEAAGMIYRLKKKFPQFKRMKRIRL